MSVHGITIPEERLAEVCLARRVKRLWIFGSVLRDDFGPRRDVDVLVELEGPGHGLFALGGLAADLEDLLGRTVHLTTLGGIPGDLRHSLLQTAQLQYAA